MAKTTKKPAPKAKATVKKKAALKKAPQKKTSAVKKLGVLKKSPGLNVGDAAPDFTMPTDTGSVSLKGLKSKNVVLYFYPKDDTSGCTAQACALRDNLPKFKKLDAEIIGVSKDSVKSHAKFREKYKLNFTLASDETSKIAERYGVWVEKSMYGRKYMGIERSTFLIDGKGKIRAIWRKVDVKTHADDVKEALAAL